MRRAAVCGSRRLCHMQRLAMRNEEKKKAALVDKLFRRLEHRDSDSEDEDDGLQSQYDRARGARNLYQQHRQRRDAGGALQDEEDSMVLHKNKALASRMQLAREEMAAAWQHTVVPPPTMSALATASSVAKTLAQRQMQRRVAHASDKYVQNQKTVTRQAPRHSGQRHDGKLTPWTQNGCSQDCRGWTANKSRGPKRARNSHVLQPHVQRPHALCQHLCKQRWVYRCPAPAST